MWKALTYFWHRRADLRVLNELQRDLVGTKRALLALANRVAELEKQIRD